MTLHLCWCQGCAWQVKRVRVCFVLTPRICTYAEGLLSFELCRWRRKTFAPCIRYADEITLGSQEILCQGLEPMHSIWVQIMHSAILFADDHLFAEMGTLKSEWRHHSAHDPSCRFGLIPFTACGDAVGSCAMQISMLFHDQESPYHDIPIAVVSLAFISLELLLPALCYFQRFSRVVEKQFSNFLQCSTRSYRFLFWLCFI